MILDFDKIEEKRIHEFRGGKNDFITRMYTDDMIKIMSGRIEPGSSIGLHLHDTSSEIIFFLSGEADLIYDGETEKAYAGQAHYCPKGHSHSMMNNGTEDLVFLAVVPEQ